MCHDVSQRSPGSGSAAAQLAVTVPVPALPVSTVALMFLMSEQSIRRLIRAGHIEAHKLPGSRRWLVPTEQFQERGITLRQLGIG